MSDTTMDTSITHTDVVDTSHPHHHGEASTIGMLDDVRVHHPDVSHAVAGVIADAEVGGTSSNVSKSPKVPSRAMRAVREGVKKFTTPITAPVKGVVNRVRARAADTLGRLKNGQHLTPREFALVFMAPAGGIFLLSHYAKMLSKKAQVAIEEGVKSWEGFLHSLGLTHDATVQDIAHAEETDAHSIHTHLAHPTGEITHGADTHHGSIAHAPAANADTFHGNQGEHPGQEQHAA